jgi:hypothetical protein
MNNIPPFNPLVGDEKNGHDWKLAPPERRSEFCDKFASRVAGVRGKDLLGGLTRFYSTEDGEILQTKIMHAMPIVIAALNR